MIHQQLHINAGMLHFLAKHAHCLLCCSVAHKFLDEVELGNDAIRSAVVEFMPYSFAAVNAQSKRFLEVSRNAAAVGHFLSACTYILVMGTVH